MEESSNEYLCLILSGFAWWQDAEPFYILKMCMEPNMKNKIDITFKLLELEVLQRAIAKVLKQSLFFMVTNGFPSKTQYGKTSSHLIEA